MLAKTLELPKQIERGLELGKSFSRDFSLTRPDTVDWIGLGGSAVAGDLITAFGFHPPLVDIRITVRRSTGAFTDPLLVSSYSGNTIETLTAFEQVPPQRIWFSMSSGGRLEELAKNAKVPHLKLPGGYPPRAALGYGLGAVISILAETHGFDGARPMQLNWNALTELADSYKSMSLDENPALMLARSMIDHTVVVYAVDSTFSGPLAFRFRTQLAENAKVWSHVAELPEMAHNEIESWPFLRELLPPPLVIFLGSWSGQRRLPDPRPSAMAVLNRLGIDSVMVDPVELWPQQSRFEAGVRTLLFLDTVSIWLAVLRAVDPFDIPIITEVKARACAS